MGFCLGCGASLEEPGAGPTLGARPPEGERKQVTVLFADVKGSVAMSGQVDAEEWRGIMVRFMRILEDGVSRFEGRVFDKAGDGIMAVVGAPTALEDHAQRACYAALHLQDQLRDYANELRRSRELNLSVRIGLNSGEIVVGEVGGKLTAHGQPVGVAHRVEQLAEPGRIYLTGNTARLTEGEFALKSLGEFALKGLEKPVPVFELTGVAARPPARRAPSRFVGRRDELAGLEQALHRATEGQGQAVGVVGEAGVGKSRLCAEFIAGCRTGGTRVLQARCPAHGKVIPYLPILELLRDAFGIGENDGDQLAREKIAGRLLLLDRAFDEALPLVFDFLGVPDPDHPAPQMSPDARKRQLFAFVRQLIQAQSEREPAVLFFDDVHWIDPASDGFLAQMVDAIDRTRTLLLVNFRPEYAAEWTRKSYYQQLALAPLGDEELAALLTDLLGSDDSVAPLPALIREKAGGNPFFTEEVVQSLVESRALEGEQGAYRLVRTVGSLEVPATVQAVLAARIDRLPEREKRVLHTAAVIGRRFGEPILAAVVELTEAELLSALRHLQAAEFILEQAVYPVAEYGFKHPLTEQVARETQLTQWRRHIHAAVARAIEALHRGKLDEQAASLAHHWEQAGEPLEAARWHLRGAEWIARTNPSEALRHARSARDLITDAAPGTETVDLELFASTEILRQGWRMGITREEIDAAFERGVELARGRDDARALAILHALRSSNEIFLGLQGPENVARGLEFGRQALTHAMRSGDRGIQIAAAVPVMSAQWLGFGDHRAPETGRDALREEPDDLTLGSELYDWSPYLFITAYTALMDAYLGRPRSALAEMEQAERLVREHGQLELEGSWCQFYMARVLGELLGEEERALLCARRALAAADKIPSATMRGYANLTAALAHYWAGQCAAAASFAEQALEAAMAVEEPLTRGVLAASRAALGNIDGARDLARRAVDLADQQGGGAHSLTTRAYWLHALLSVREAATAEEFEAAVMDLERRVVERGWASYRPVIHLGRAEIARRQGDAAAREDHLREAHRLFVELGATRHAERALQELGR